MIRIYKKNIGNKGYFYIETRVRFRGVVKKIQLYIGKNAPKNTSKYFDALDKADDGFYTKLLRYTMKSYRETAEIFLKEKF